VGVAQIKTHSWQTHLGALVHDRGRALERTANNRRKPWLVSRDVEF